MYGPQTNFKKYGKLIKVMKTWQRNNLVIYNEDFLKTHLKDVEFLALALKLDCLIWTYEELFFDIGFGISTKQTSSKINLFEL